MISATQSVAPLFLDLILHRPKGKERRGGDGTCRADFLARYAYLAGH
jgi:hypothetical protein